MQWFYLLIYKFYRKLQLNPLPKLLFNHCPEAVYAPTTLYIGADKDFSIEQQNIIREAIKKFEYFVPFFKIEISFDFNILEEYLNPINFLLLAADSESYIIKKSDSECQTGSHTLGYWMPGQVGLILLVMDRLQDNASLTRVTMHELGHALGVPHIKEKGIMHPLLYPYYFFNKNDAEEFAKVYKCKVENFRYFKI